MPAAVTTTSAAAIRAGRSVTGGITRSRPGPQPEASAASRPAVPGTDTTVTSRGTSTRPSASTTSGAQPPGSVPPITTSTVSGPTPADRRRRCTSPRTGVNRLPRRCQRAGAGASSRSAPTVGSTRTSAARAPNRPSTMLDSSGRPAPRPPRGPPGPRRRGRSGRRGPRRSRWPPRRARLHPPCAPSSRRPDVAPVSDVSNGPSTRPSRSTECPRPRATWARASDRTTWPTPIRGAPSQRRRILISPRPGSSDGPRR